jgi:hypothetical protein
MDKQQLSELLATMLENRYPGQYRKAFEDAPPGVDNGWVLEQDGLVCLARPAGANHPFVWQRIGVAIEIPLTAELAFYVAAKNKSLDVGRAYMDAGDGVALVVMDETLFGAAIAWEFQPSIDAFLSHFQTAFTQARSMQAEIFERYGGRQFAGGDWFHMAF